MIKKNKINVGISKEIHRKIRRRKQKFKGRNPAVKK
jgi:hypothetical protein